MAAPSLTRRLIALGSSDPDRAERFLGARELDGVDTDHLLEGLASAPDPDGALLTIVRLIERRPEVRELIDAGTARSESLFRLVGASEALGDFLVRHPEHLDGLTGPVSPEPVGADPDSLRGALLRSVGADPAAPRPVATATGPEAYAALRVAYLRHLCSLAVRDLGAASPTDFLPTAAAELSDLAGAALEAALAVSRAEAARTFGREDVAAVGLAVIGMGKCGARELNYISDVDVVYVIEARDAAATPGGEQGPDPLDPARAVQIGTALATGLARAVWAPGREPALWQVDANLRPEGRDGPLVRTLESHLAYYARWAQSWEFQALLKARCIAGDRDLGARYEQAVAPLVWASAGREGFVESVQAMRRRVTDNIPAAEADRQIKLGAGGLRDVEFTVQLLQLVHGRTDESLRVRDTTSAIAALAAGGYIGRTAAAEFDSSYRYLRLLEHRLQLSRLRRTHLMPTSEDALRALARSVQGVLETSRASPEQLLEAWHRTKRRVRELHEQIFYRPLLNTVAHLSLAEARLTPEAAEARLAALGYRDPQGAMRHIEALTAGVSRRAALQRQLLPVLLGWIAEGADPDAGLLAFRRVSEALGTTHWYLGLLRDSSAAAERLSHVLADSRLIADLLEVSPESVKWLGDDQDLVPLTLEAQWQEIQSKLSRHEEPSAAMRLVRLIRRREILRIALADSSGVLDTESVGRALSDVDQAAVLGALRVAEGQAEAADGGLLTHVLVVAMGRQGGREIGYGSDADVMYVHRALPGARPEDAQRQALAIVTSLSALLTQPLKPPVLAERVLALDADLRPEGKNGPLVRSFDSFAEYYRRWALTWEAQALLRARPMAGDAALAADFMALVDTVRYPEELGPDEVREIRRIKARVEAERLPRGADPSRHVKLGRGGLSDVEWLVQLIQLKHAARHPELRTTGTMEALSAATDLGLIAPHEAELLGEAWRLASRIRSANVAWSGRASDLVPTKRRDLEAVARWCGYLPDQATAFEQHYLNVTRRARQVFERRFYGVGE
ncbi:glutamate-ammonia-ligase adenylyltransferase [Sinomonas cellulolyticus]|uniref:Bifunctional glutamine synthetase adenylyltransferase/adenylyl-removing enzyme n=1 Tax=Sinomonas cellulolyticus TaxID=2801916 RepID=A0ABS1K1E2_9MICC|nr:MULTISPECIES: bifunctional [glutamine synthetase] adenylyltransferase/[glutamine synthetase]-adenylyl-L-tyrosine phosphorylase [Sinomonas]MBL0705481.1 bifunctional [glutamine synthetase] adenylyltransferase/[glutamine synthetase]-adenylyl-L-tyrosine phosphorylase [Sinomonas cellulolyticus]GHG41413.1 glutamate-ammonia-ligase adenylyltransferase [Sinomonas sp. KCTC 49339]